MGRFLCFAIGLMLIQNYASAQTVGMDGPAVVAAGTDNKPTTSTAGTTIPVAPEYVPMTASERARKYILGAFGPGAIVRAAASAGISQGTVTPKEWGVGLEAYGDRFGNAFAKHAIREALEYGMSAALHEDNRYFRSTESGFFKRSKHAVASVFVARNEAGGSISHIQGSGRFWAHPSYPGFGSRAVKTDPETLP